MRRKRAAALTVDERSFQNPKLETAVLVAYKTVADVAGKGSLLVVTIVAARALSPEGFGIFSLGTTLGWILTVAADCGIQLHVARAIARHPADAALLVRTWLRVRTTLAIAAVAIVVCVAALSGWPSGFALPITLFAIAYACSGLVEFLYYAFRGLSRTDIESSLTLWHRGAMLVSACAALAIWPNVTALAAALLLAGASTLIAGMAIARRVVRSAAPDRRPPDSRALSIDYRSEFANVWPVGAGIVLSALYFRVDVFLVQMWSGTGAVARYNAVFRLVDALRLFPAAVVAVALPSLCRARDLRALVRAAVPMTAAAIAGSVAVSAAATWLIPAIYGVEYVGAVPAFRILLLSFPLMTLNMALTHQLVGWNRERAYAVLCGCALAVNLALNARLIAALSIDGAAWATVGTEAFLTAGCAAVLARVQRGRIASTAPPPRPLPREGEVAIG